MKKRTISISSFWLLTAILSGVCFFYSCNHSDCSKYEITSQEIAFLSAYNQGDIAIFKNDSTFVFDTLHVTEKSYGTGYYYEPCNTTVNNTLNVFISFKQLAGNLIQIIHDESPKIIYSNYVQFSLIGSLQSMAINGTNYNDVYITSIDSTLIHPPYQNTAPWKIAYSKSKGFVRFYMVNGQTWSKL